MSEHVVSLTKSLAVLWLNTCIHIYAGLTLTGNGINPYVFSFLLIPCHLHTFTQRGTYWEKIIVIIISNDTTFMQTQWFLRNGFLGNLCVLLHTKPVNVQNSCYLLVVYKAAHPEMYWMCLVIYQICIKVSGVAHIRIHYCIFCGAVSFFPPEVYSGQINGLQKG